MKKLVMMLFFVLASCFIYANMLKNGQFEIHSNGKPSWWYVKGDISRVEAPDFPNAEYSMLLKSKNTLPLGSSSSQEEKDSAIACLGISFKIPDFEKNYTLSFYAKSSCRDQPFNVNMAGYSKNSKPVFKGKKFKLTENWKKYSFICSFPGKKWKGRNCNVNFSLTYGSASVANIELVQNNITTVPRKPSGISWTSDRKNILINPGFELKWQGWIMDYRSNYEEGPPVTFDSEIKQAGKYSLKIPPYNKVSSLRYNIDPKSVYTLSFYARTSKGAKGNTGTVMIITPFWTGVKAPMDALSDQWQRFSVTFKGSQLIRPPKIFNKTCPPYEVNSAYVFAASLDSTIWVDSFQLEKGEISKYSAPVDIGYAPDTEYAVYTVNDNIYAKVKIYHAGGIKNAMRLKCFAENVYGKLQWEKEYEVKPTNENFSEFNVNLPETLGVISVKSELSEKTGKIAVGEWRYFVVDNLKKLNNPMLGVHPAGNISPVWLAKERIKILRLLGVDFVTLYTSTHRKNIEAHNVKNICNILRQSGISKIVSLVAPKHFLPIGSPFNTKTYLKKFNPDYKKFTYKKPGEEEERRFAEQFAKYFEHMLNEYKGYIDEFYVLGEPNLARAPDGQAFWPPELVARIYKATRNRLKAHGHPFIGGSMNGGDLPYFAGLLKNGAGKYIDKMNFHGYRASPEDPFLYGEIIRMQKLARKYNKNISFVNNEQYYGLRHEYQPWDELGAKYTVDSEADHAARMVQNFLHHLAGGVPLSITAPQSCLLDYGGVNPIFYFYSFGGIRNASKLLNEVINSSHIEVHKGLRCFLFVTKEGKKIASLNTKEPDAKGFVSFPEKCEYALDINGNKIKQKNLLLSWLPVYLVFNEQATSQEVKDILNSANYKGLDIPVNVDFRLSANKDKVTINISNLYSRNVSGTMKFTSPADIWEDINFDLKAKSQKKHVRKIPSGFFASDKNPRISYIIESDDVIQTKSFRLPSFSVNKLKNVNIDGELSDWEYASWLKLDERYLFKKSARNPYSGPEDLSAKLAFGWDENYFYLAIQVNDNEKCFGDGAQTGAFYTVDSLQVYFDQKNNAKKGKSYDGDDVVYQFGLNSKGNPVAWLEKNPTGRYVGANNLDKGIDGDISTAFKETKTGYIWEIAFPWKVLPQLDVKEGTTLGFSLFIFDKDRDGTKKTLTLGVDNETNYRNPYVWRGIELVRFCQK